MNIPFEIKNEILFLLLYLKKSRVKFVLAETLFSRSLLAGRRCAAASCFAFFKGKALQSVRQRAPEYDQQAEGKEEKTGNGAEDNNEGRLKETQQGYAAAAGQAAFHGRKWKKERPAPGAGLSQT